MESFRIFIFITIFCAVHAAPANPLQCSFSGVFATLADGDTDLQQNMETISRVAFELIPGGTIAERIINHMDRMEQQKASDTCEAATMTYLSHYFYTKTDIDKILRESFDGLKWQIIQTHLHTMNSEFTTFRRAQVKDRPIDQRALLYFQYALKMSVESLKILELATDHDYKFKGNLDVQFIWVVKALDGMKQAFDSAVIGCKFLRDVPDDMKNSQIRLVVYDMDIYVKDVINNMIKFNNMFWQRIVPQNQRYYTTRVNNLKPTSIQAHDIDQTRKWRRWHYEYLNGDNAKGDCIKLYTANIQCDYESELHTDRKGPIYDFWYRHNFIYDHFTSKSSSCDNWYPHYTKIRYEPQYAGDYIGVNAAAEQFCCDGRVQGLTAKTYCRQGSQYSEALWFYETDDFYRLENAFLRVFWKGNNERRYAKYKKQYMVFWILDDFQEELNKRENQVGMVITDILWNLMVEASQKYGRMTSKKLRPAKPYGDVPYTLSEYSYQRRRMNSEALDPKDKELFELLDILDNTSSDDLIKMETENDDLMEKLLDLGESHGKRPPKLPKSITENLKDLSDFDREEIIKSMSAQQTIAHIEAADDDFSDNMNAGDIMTDTASADDDISDNMNAGDITAVNADDSLDSIDNEDGLAMTFSIDKSMHSTWNTAQLGVCLSVGAGLTYLYKSYNSKEQINVEYDVLIEDI